ncbi:hypothetical protein EIP91_009545, partial [Steccherinum ochraceum]
MAAIVVRIHLLPVSSAASQASSGSQHLDRRHSSSTAASLATRSVTKLLGRLCTEKTTYDSALKLHESLKDLEVFQDHSKGLPTMCAYIASSVLGTLDVAWETAWQAGGTEVQAENVLSAVRKHLRSTSKRTLSYKFLAQTHHGYAGEYEHIVRFMEAIEKDCQRGGALVPTPDLTILGIFCWTCTLFRTTKACNIVTLDGLADLYEVEELDIDKIISLLYKKYSKVADAVQKVSEGDSPVPLTPERLQVEEFLKLSAQHLDDPVSNSEASSPSNHAGPSDALPRSPKSPQTVIPKKRSSIGGSSQSSSSTAIEKSPKRRRVAGDLAPPRQNRDASRTLGSSSDSKEVKFELLVMSSRSASPLSKSKAATNRENKHKNARDVSGSPAVGVNPSSQLSRNRSRPSTLPVAKLSSSVTHHPSQSRSPGASMSGSSRGAANRPSTRNSSPDPLEHLFPDRPASNVSTQSPPTSGVVVRDPNAKDLPPTPPLSTSSAHVSVPAKDETSVNTLAGKLRSYTDAAALNVVAHVLEHGCEDVELRLKVRDLHTRLDELKRIREWPSKGVERANADKELREMTES